MRGDNGHPDSGTRVAIDLLHRQFKLYRALALVARAADPIDALGEDDVALDLIDELPLLLGTERSSGHAGLCEVKREAATERRLIHNLCRLVVRCS